ncbi:hypothetical protein TWF225_001739 [Orbilia oligospora]|nr:hypothetical protein TWF225_001739 [Orbilia oligospora]KAF3245608.1 hypothetical protein TWF217_010440 [Orbilia oligospora]KAF3262623.1 hypothetical protein TWF128_002384 [Orbilia oligospora]KAF3275151.1 hypothetical protein TWF132_002998 [Orbilia oligospora]
MPCMQPSVPDHLRRSDDDIDRELDRLFEELRWIQMTAERINAQLAGSTSRCGCIDGYGPPDDPASKSTSTSRSNISTRSTSEASSSGTRRRRIFPLFRY